MDRCSCRRACASCVIILMLSAACGRDPATTLAGDAPTGPFYVVATAPENGALGIAVAKPPVTVVFSTAVDPSSVHRSTLRIERMEAEVRVAGHTATLEPVTRLGHGTTYAVVVAAAVRDTAGNRLGRDFRFSFTTKRVSSSSQTGL
jgi:hypothetical protein